MTMIFWTSFALVCYAYFGYAILLRYGTRPRAVEMGRDEAPALSLSILIAAHNEARNLPRRLENLRELDYPEHLVQTVIVSDGSTDETGSLLQGAPGITAIVLPVAGGKANALNHAVRTATGKILVFLDVRQTIARNALRELVAPFADQTVGAVSGELLLDNPHGSGSEGGLGLYWKIEKAVRRLESDSGSVIGVTGAIYAIRRELYVNIPPNTILDDVFVPMNIARAGKRIIFQSTATARDRIFTEPRKEFARKVRTLTGNYQLLKIAPWLLTPANPLLFRFISHKLLRLLVPLFLLLMIGSSALIGGPLYLLLLVLQVIFYSLAFLGAAWPAAQRFKPVAVAHTFCMLNLAAALAFCNFVLGREAVWT